VRIFGEIGLATSVLFVAVDIVPCFGFDVRECPWGDADNLAVPVMCGFDRVLACSEEGVDSEGNVRGDEVQRPRIGRKWVKIDVVNEPC
jgi:hypothetical protein